VAEVYARIEAFGQAGRAAYARMTFTRDLLFPLVLFVFLVQLLRFLAERASRPRYSGSLSCFRSPGCSPTSRRTRSSTSF
jgi:hypothetical protein